jgi:uncharacterized protein (UPF0335 family)
VKLIKEIHGPASMKGYGFDVKILEKFRVEHERKEKE